MEEEEDANSFGIQQGVPPKFNASHFLTTRWRAHTQPTDYKKNKISQTIIDLTRVSEKDLLPVDSIHLPIRYICQQRRLHLRKAQSLLVINHYLKSYEQFQLHHHQKAVPMGGETILRRRPWYRIG
jgi:hypothetical protein